jgi:hypothetical protein
MAAWSFVHHSRGNPRLSEPWQHLTLFGLARWFCDGVSEGVRNVLQHGLAARATWNDCQSTARAIVTSPPQDVSDARIRLIVRK